MRREEAGKDVCVCVCVCVDAYMSNTLKEQSCDGCTGDIKHGSHPCIPCLNSRRLHKMNHDQLWLEKGGQAPKVWVWGSGRVRLEALTGEFADTSMRRCTRPSPLCCCWPP